ncbi:transporter, CPA2 family [Mariniphaga anaerophila]|uniref:Transporter, CPA2 family n=1 Tax=Mariniphaga anaerophila TaxID=1484053 RepID=A0A1M4YII3_9BACT|nr:cation:proton antiporter [Mariniphaga anaerophila]SHF05577.1 transporter, CPA2 family [Mariniphaga anaerophila]
MLLFVNTIETTLPLSNPVLKFLVILLIILFAPILLNRVKIPHLLGLIIAGTVIGPFGFNLISRDSSIILSGTAGLLYIMFLAGLEIDMADFKKNVWKSSLLGIAGFLIPMALGTFMGVYVLKYSLMTSVLMASMFSSHTLITYPIVSKLGITKNKAVNITVGSTLITNVLALLVLAVVVGMTSGEMDKHFWIRLPISFIVFSSVIMLLFPVVARWFFKRYDDNVSQYIFVLVLVFTGAVFSELAGVEGIIGAFLAGLALNRLIPRTSPLMNRIDFVGNAIFIPFFLLGVGMLIDYRAFFSDTETLIVAVTMSVVATVGKFIPAWIVQKIFGFSLDQRRLIFGLSNAQAAATLAAVLVGYNVIIGHTADGEPIRLLSESILNGTIIMILVTCTIASFETQRGAEGVAREENSGMEEESQVPEERILIPVSNPETVNELIQLSTLIKSKKNKAGLFGLNIVSNSTSLPDAGKNAKKVLEKAAMTAAATDIHLTELLRYDLNVVNGITSVIKEHSITDLVLGLHVKKGISESFLGNLTEGILAKSNITTLVYKPAQPVSTVKRHFIVVPENAEKEVGFPFWLLKTWNIARNSGAKLLFYGTETTLEFIRKIHSKHPVEAEFHLFDDWDDFLILSRDVKEDDNLIVVLSRKNKTSYHSNMSNVPKYLNKYFQGNSFILVYPMQVNEEQIKKMDLNYPSLLEPIEKLDEIGKTIAGLFKRK